ncbi:MarR family winged helix-turn-helix transcriptional regulator [Desertibaculum subflavum]|uniref:MarR family winged helix-turn-helix transcriptional regulator n=1 Tax=Desertibaculum subflavum TaxID=2268458 RepID=UPI000E668D92
MAGRDDIEAPRFSCTCSRIRKAARRVTQIYDQFLEPTGLTITQFGMLAQLKRHDGITIGGLAEKMIMDPTTLTRNLRPIERDGLVRQVPDPDDRRARQLHLTPRGRAAFEKARPAWAKAQRHMETTLGEPETEVLNAVLDRSLARLTA